MSRKHITNVFEAILEYGHDEDFVPKEGADFQPTDAPAGSEDKIEALRKRVLAGKPLWHGEDRKDYTGLHGVLNEAPMSAAKTKTHRQGKNRKKEK
jgi:hypothetical protein